MNEPKRENGGRANLGFAGRAAGLLLAICFLAAGVGSEAWAKSGGAGAAATVTYGQLATLIANKGLVVGGKYRLSDFRTRHTIPYSTEVHSGQTEVLTLTANSPQTLEPVAVSEEYPLDIIHYTVRNELFALGGTTPDPAVDRGCILYRQDPRKNVEAGEDFRNVRFRRWESAAGNGVYALSEPRLAPEGAGYRDFPMFADYDSTSGVSIRPRRGGDGHYLSNLVFMAKADRVSFPEGAESATFLAPVANSRFGFCQQDLFQGPVLDTELGESRGLSVSGALDRVFIRKRSLTVKGSLSEVEVLASYPEETISGDYSHKVFGASDLDFGDYPAAFGRKPFFAADFTGGLGVEANAPFIGGAIAGGGVKGAAPGVVTSDHPGVVCLIDSELPKSGYRYLTDPAALQLKGGEVFTGVVAIDTFAQATIRLGFLDTSTSADAEDGCYFEIGTGGVAVGKCASHAQRSKTAGSYTLSLATWYTYRISLDASGGSALFEIFNNAGTSLFSGGNTVSANLPTSPGTETGAGLVATRDPFRLPAASLLHLDYMSYSLGVLAR